MVKMITVKPKKELVISKGVSDNYPRWISLKENPDAKMHVPRKLFEDNDIYETLDIRLIQVNNVPAIDNYLLYLGDLIGEGHNNDAPEALLEVLKKMYWDLHGKREKVDE